MSVKRKLIGCLAMVLLLGGTAPYAVADEALDKALETLKTYDWGQDRKALGAIDNAVVAAHGNAAATKELEGKLAAVLKTDAPQAAKDYVCRKFSVIGSAECVPAVSALLTDPKLSHMGRYVLERMPAPEAVKALRDALPKVSGKQKVGVINSLGARRDAESVPALVALLENSDQEIAGAAAAALGDVGTPDAAKALGAYQEKAPKELRLVATDAYLICAERLLADGKKLDALAVYKALSKSEVKHVRLAAMRGLLAATGAKQ